MNINPEIFKNNWEALQKRYPELCEKLKNVTVGEKYNLFQQPNCIPNVMHENRPYYHGQLNKLFDAQFEGLELDNVKMATFMGFGLGYEVMYFLQTMAQKQSTQFVLIIEKDLELFMAAMNITDLTKLINDEHIFLFVGIPISDLYIELRTHFQKHINHMLLCGATQPIFTQSAMRINKDYYMNAIHIAFESLYHSIQNFGNCPEDSLVGLENMLDNVGEIVNNPGINLLYDKFKGKPAIIVATGPSLKKNMHLLKGLEDKALMLSVDASFKLLMRNDIKPHMVTSLEREHEVEQFFDNFNKKEVEDVYMTTCPVLFNHVYKSYVGPKIMVYRNFDHFKWLEIERGILEIKLSSANMAFKIAEALGCDPIILVGQDLAYGENNETHATEVPFSSEGEGIFFMKGNIQDKVKTNSGWYNFLKAFELDISKYNGKVINCTEGGAYIKGTEIDTFKNVIDKYITEKYDPLDIIKSTLKDFTKDNVENDIEKLKKKIDFTENEIEIIIDLCKKGVESCNKYNNDLQNDIDDEAFVEIRKEIIEPRLKISKVYKDTFQLFLMHVIQSYHLKFEMEAAMECKNPKEILLKFSEWYCFIGDISQICLESLLKAKEKIYANK